MDVRDGYKLTELGVIPNNWEVNPLRQAIRLINGRAFKQQELLFEGKYLVLRVGNFFSNGNWYYSSLELSDEQYVNNGDLMYAWSASFGPKFWQSNKAIYHYHIWKVKVNRDVDKIFMYYLFEFDKQKILEQSQGGTMFHITKTDMERRKVILPPLPEQTAIAEVLSDTDSLIQALEKIIAKKRNIKQGAMQKLLRPKEGWEVKKLGEICEFSSGTAHENFIDSKGQFIVVNSKFISTDGEIKKYANTLFCPVNAENILIVLSDVPNGRAIAKCFFVQKERLYTINQRIGIIKVKNVHPKYLFFLINRHKDLLAFDDGVKQTNLRNQDILNLKLNIYNSPIKQAAVAEYLSDMEAEISVLINKLEKYKMLKLGMMQNLLTGKIRLIKS